MRRALLETAVDDSIERERNRADGERRRIVLQDRGHPLDRGIAGKGVLPGEHFVEHRAKRKDVGPVIGSFTAHLLWSHVAGGAQNLPGARRWRGGQMRDAGVRSRSFDEFGQPEVENLRAAVGGHEDVAGFQIAVNDALGVRGGQAQGDLHGQIGRAARRERPLEQRRRQRLAFEQFEHDVGDAAVHANVEHRHHVRVVEGGRGPRLLLEALHAVGVLGERFRQHFHGDASVEARVQRAVDLAHAASAKGLDYFVGAKPRASRESQSAIIATRSAPSRARSGAVIVWSHSESSPLWNETGSNPSNSLPSSGTSPARRQSALWK